jgi:hypothetical protein
LSAGERMLKYNYRFSWTDPKSGRARVKYLDAGSKTEAEKDFEASFGMDIEKDGVKVLRVKD